MVALFYPARSNLVNLSVGKIRLVTRRRDPAATQARILSAATAEFAEHGLEGARYDRIAARAPANKERIYAYFGDKQQLFASVLEDQMPRFAAAHAIAEPDRIAALAGELFDFHADNPELTRMVLWEALTYGSDPVPATIARAEHYNRRREAVTSALGTASQLDPGHVSFALTSLVAWWFAAPQLASFHIDADPHSPHAHATHRALVIEAATRLLSAPATKD